MLTASRLYEWIQTSFQPSLLFLNGSHDNDSDDDDWRKTLHLSDIQRVRQMDTLWAGKGIIYRVTMMLTSSSYHNEEGEFTIEMIVKHVFPCNTGIGSGGKKKSRNNHDDDVKLSFGDRRKIKSYHVEYSFYHSVASILLQHGVSVPHPYYVNRRCHDINNHDRDEIMIMMAYIVQNQTIINRKGEEYIIYKVLQWLASFHAVFWGTHEYVNGIIERYQLQSYGSYWNLPTRPEEYKSMLNTNNWKGKLKTSAQEIHHYLYEHSPYQCVIHGDTKIDNILFHYSDTSSSSCQQSQNKEPNHRKKKRDANKKEEDNIVNCDADDDNISVTLCDFQYCGKGSPATDIAYFFVSSIHEHDCTEHYVEYYLKHLQERLIKSSSSNTKKIPTIDEMMNMIDIAYCDFYRFMCGWGFWGSHERGQHRVIRGLKQFEK